MIKEIQEWFKRAVPEPRLESLSVQIGCDIEEQREQISCFEYTTHRHLIRSLIETELSFKECQEAELEEIKDILRVECSLKSFVDAQADKIVTSVGILHMLGIDAHELLERVNDSNFSKFEDGKPVFDENGKIKKGKNYCKPIIGDLVANRKVFF